MQGELHVAIATISVTACAEERKQPHREQIVGLAVIAQDQETAVFSPAPLRVRMTDVGIAVGRACGTIGGPVQNSTSGTATTTAIASGFAVALLQPAAAIGGAAIVSAATGTTDVSRRTGRHRLPVFLRAFT